MKSLIIVVLAFIACTSTAIQAQTITRKPLDGARHVSPGVISGTTATFEIGMSLDGGSTYVETARLGDSVVISGVVRPEAGDIAKTGDVFIVEKSDQNTFSMRTAAGDYVSWNGSVPALVPFLDNQILTPEMTVEIFSGQLGFAGGKRLFLGYMPADGILRFTPAAARVEVTTQSVRDEAVAMFASSISNNIVPICIACHFSGSPTVQGRALHEFVFPNNVNHLSINFTQFENLTHAKGSAYVLSKVQGGNNHEGGVLLLPGSVDYNNLAAFLSLLEQL